MWRLWTSTSTSTGTETEGRAEDGLSFILTFPLLSITPLSVVFGTVYSLQQLGLSLLNVTLGHVSTVEVNQMDSRG